MVLKTQGHKRVIIFPASSFPVKSFLASQGISWFHMPHA